MLTEEAMALPMFILNSNKYLMSKYYMVITKNSLPLERINLKDFSLIANYNFHK